MPTPAKNPARVGVPSRDADATSPATAPLARAVRSATTDSPPATTSAARIAASPANKPQLRMRPAPIPVELPPHRCANPAPAAACHFWTPTRRALLAGGLAATLCPASGFADVTRGAGQPPGGGLGDDGASPGPVLRGKVGQPLPLMLANALDSPASFAVWGLGVDAGFPASMETPPVVDERHPRVVTPREAGFGFYRASGPASTTKLFGAVVIEEAAPPPTDLDMVVLLSGDTSGLCVNGAALPLTLNARPGARVRLRLANACSDALLALSAPQGAQVVAIDSQPCEMFAPAAGSLPLAPSARFELLFDFADQGAEFAAEGRPALRIVAAGERVAARPPIAPLSANPRLPLQIALERAKRVDVPFREFPTGAPLNRAYSLSGAENLPLFTAKRGQPVVLTMTNQTPTPQTMRLEGHWARILHALDDGWDPYWRDTLHVEPGRKLLAAFVADAPGNWSLASASPDKRAKGLAAWFQVA